eukprot:6902227-Prymnesium_polylepis.1
MSALGSEGVWCQRLGCDPKKARYMPSCESDPLSAKGWGAGGRHSGHVSSPPESQGGGVRPE